MGKSVSVGIGTKVRVFILFLLGAVFLFPGLLLVVAGFMEPDITADDTLAMFFMGGMSSLCGLIIWMAMRKVYRKAKRQAVYRSENVDPMAMGLAHGQYMASMHDMDNSDVEVDTDFDSGDSGDYGGFDGGSD